MSNNKKNNPFRLNIGFIVGQTNGYSRDFEFEEEYVYLPPDLELQDLAGKVRVTRTAHGLLVQAHLKAKTQIECVRCLETFDQPLEIDFTELYAFSPKSVTDSNLLLPESGIIDLRPMVREEMVVNMPINPICKTDCQGLCPVCGENRNLSTCNHEDENIDPRLAVLKSLLKEE